MRNIIFASILIVFCAEVSGQDGTTLLSGKVSFISTQNVYVKFNSTQGISVGDTLFLQQNGAMTPALVVTNKSSLSCICIRFPAVMLAVADNLVAKVKLSGKIKASSDKAGETANQVITGTPIDSATVKQAKYSPENDHKQMIRGSTSLASYIDNSNTPGPSSQRFRYTLNLDARNIGDSKFSIESYVSFNYKSGQWDLVRSDIFSALKIYNLALTYSPDKSMLISLGRRINPRISSMGASDGLQIEKSFNRFTLGALAGSRPDYANYGWNFNLLQYGAFVAYDTKSATSYTSSSLAFVDQMNNSKTDRRFIYFQHSNSVIRNLTFFSTFEVDLYKMVVDSLGHEKSSSTFDLTGLYLSLNYRLARILTISGSYDARKNVIYYETYKTYLDRILEDQLRQGYRAWVSANITRDIILGVQAGYRFLKADPHPSKNINAYLTYSQIPGIRMMGTISATMLESGYMNGNIYGLSLSKDFFNGKIQTGLAYQYVDYKMLESLSDIRQNIGEINFTWQIARKLFFSLYYEGTFENQDKYNRFYLQLRKRF